jgi:hypothetical protein
LDLLAGDCSCAENNGSEGVHDDGGSLGVEIGLFGCCSWGWLLDNL